MLIGRLEIPEFKGFTPRCQYQFCEEEDLLERAVGDGDIQSELYHQGYLRSPTFSFKPKPVVWRRPHVSSMSKPSNAEAHLGGMQDLPHPRPLHLAAQPGKKLLHVLLFRVYTACKRAT